MAPLYFVASYPRSGNTWVRLFIFSLMKLSGYLPSTATPYEVDNYLPWDAVAELYRVANHGEDVPRRDRVRLRHAVHRQLEDSGHPMKVVKSHTLFGTVGGSPLFSQEWRGACYLVRNPFDVAPSLSRLLNTSVDAAISIMEQPLYLSSGRTAELWGSWSQNVDSWTGRQRDDVLVLRYEDLANEMPRIVAHAGFTASDGVVSKAMQLTSLAQLERLEATGQARIPIKSTDQFFGGGATRPYQDKLSSEQARRIITAHHETMERFGYLDAEAMAFAKLSSPLDTDWRAS